MSFVSNWVLSNIVSALAEYVQQLLNAFGDVIDNIFVIVTEFNNSITENITDFTIPFAIALICFFAAQQYFSVYTLETSGDPDADPLDIIVRAAEAIAIAVSTDTIFTYFLKFSDSFVSDLQQMSLDVSPGESASVVDVLTDMLSAPLNLKAFPVVVITLAIGMTIALLVFTVMAGIRGAELTLFRLLFPIFAVDFLTTNRERWNSFFTSYIVTWLAYGIQIICFKMFSLTIVTFTTCAATEFWKIACITTGWMVLMIRSPRWLDKFVYSSGISNGIRGGMRSGVYMAGMFRRR